MDLFENARALQRDEIVVRRALWGKVLGQLPPLAAGGNDVEYAVDERAARHAALRRQERLDQRIFLIGQVTLITQTLALVASAVLRRPHRCPRESTRTGAQNHKGLYRLKKNPD